MKLSKGLSRRERIMRKKEMQKLAEACFSIVECAKPNLYFGEMFDVLHQVENNIEEGTTLDYEMAVDYLVPKMGKVVGFLLGCVHYDEATDKVTVVSSLTVGKRCVTIERTYQN
jgi:hypothetical protein